MQLVHRGPRVGPRRTSLTAAHAPQLQLFICYSDKLIKPYHAHTCTHCCACHITHRSKKGYGRGCVPWRNCRCQANCPPSRCAQWECPSRLFPAAAVDPQPPPPPSPSTQELQVDSDDEHQPQPVLSRTSSRPHPSIARFVDEQAQRGRLGEFSRRAQQERAAVAAAAAASLAVAIQPPAAPAQPDTQLPTVADIASHRPLYDTLSYALQPLWRDICESAFERYRQASTAKNAEAMAAALVSILQLPAKHLVKQRVPARIRRLFKRQQLRASDWQAQRLRDQLRDAQGLAAAQAASQRQREVSNALPADHDNKYDTDSEPEAESEVGPDISDDTRTTTCRPSFAHVVSRKLATST